MKAKVIATGEIIEVSLVKNTKSTYVDSNNHFYPDTKLEIIPDIDWEQRRFELAKAAMCGMLSGNTLFEDPDTLSENAVCYADAVIAKLKSE